MRIVMMGTGPFAVPTFRWLIESEHEVPLLVTRPVPPTKGRQKAPANPTRDVADEAGIEVYAPADANDEETLQRAKDWGAELYVVCDYGQILSNELLSVPRLGGINLHGSLLPKYRGAAPINWAIMKGEPKTGITVIHMTPKLDAGPCLTRREEVIEPDDDAITMERKLSLVGVDAVREAIQLLESWDGESTIGEIQDPQQACHARRLRKQDALVDWTHSGEQILNRVRGLKPWPGTYTHWQKKKQLERVILDQITLLPLKGESDPHAGCDAEPGTVVRCDREHLWVRGGDCIVAINRLQVAGKRVMEIAEFLRGQQIPEGTKLQ